MSRAEFVCPACRATVPAPPSLAGQSAPCPRCRSQVDCWPAPVPTPKTIPVTKPKPLPAALEPEGDEPEPSTSPSWLPMLIGVACAIALLGAGAAFLSRARPQPPAVEQTPSVERPPAVEVASPPVAPISPERAPLPRLVAPAKKEVAPEPKPESKPAQQLVETAPAPHVPASRTDPAPPITAVVTTEVAPPPRRAPYRSDRPAKEVFAGYYLRTPQKFTLYVSRLAYEMSDEAHGEPLKVVLDEIDRIAALFPEAALAKLRKVTVWVEWDHVIPRSVDAYAVFYHQAGHELWSEGVDKRKAGNICVLSLKVAHQLRNKRNYKQNTLLHEFAHAIHAYAFGFENAVIKNAYVDTHTG